MNSSFYNGVSGIKTHQFGLDVWANNISNISTLGFKGSRPEFSSLFSTALSGSYFDPTSNDKGLGAQSQTTAMDLAQGILENTDNPFDLAISGEGWFGVQGQDAQIYYTRSGAFSIDSNGNLVDGGGNYLMATSGANITAASLSPEKIAQFGKYYNATNDTYSDTIPYQIATMGDVPLGAVGGQSTVTLPDYLYFPPDATNTVNYQANLDPSIITETSLTQNAAINAITLNVDPLSATATISGTMANNTDISNLKEGDTVILTLLDEDNGTLRLEAILDSDLNFSLSGADISNLDENTLITLGDELQVRQEIPNVEHFTTDIVAPNGERDILDMTFTKRVPQQASETVWDAQVQILRYFEDYQVQSYNPDITYDPTLYNVDIVKNQVTKIYDPLLYKIDTAQSKVYEIIDSQIGSTTFGGGGQIISSTIPPLSNSGETLTLSIGNPYEQTPVTVGTMTLSGSSLTISGTAPLSTTQEGIQAGDNVAIVLTDTAGESITTSAKVNADGTWTTTYTNYPLNTATPTADAYVVLSTGYDGMISHVDLEKERIATKDGYVEGYLTNYGMDGNGNVIAEFSNGRSSAIAKVAVYHFQNDQGLTPASSTYFLPSSNSGNPIFYTNANGESFLGSKIVSYKTEGSNVSMATALTELIIMQKAFDASAKSITTSDQMIQNAINMKK